MSERGGVGSGGSGGRRQPSLFDRAGAPVEENLPWLEAVDDDDDEGVAVGGLAITALIACLLLAVAAGLGWWLLHRSGGGVDPDGSLIEAPAIPYKVRPADPGGKEFEGTGDSSYIVGEGGTPGAALDDDDSPPPVAAPTAAGANPATTIARPGGVGVQIGAFPTREKAEAAWALLSRDHDVLTNLPHRVLEGRADLGAVFFLQAVPPGGDGEARTLCDNLAVAGVKCQVKR